MKQVIDNKFNAGDEVYAKVSPEQALIVRRYVDRIYYCTIKEDASHKDLVYFERELLNPAAI